jgi:hypothetical protein
MSLMEGVLAGVKDEIQHSSERREAINDVMKHIWDLIRTQQGNALRLHRVAAPVVLAPADGPTPQRIVCFFIVFC